MGDGRMRNNATGGHRQDRRGRLPDTILPLRNEEGVAALQVGENCRYVRFTTNHLCGAGQTRKFAQQLWSLPEWWRREPAFNRPNWPACPPDVSAYVIVTANNDEVLGAAVRVQALESHDLIGFPG